MVKQVVIFILVLLLQLIFENSIQNILSDNTIRFSFSVSFLFIINCVVFLYFEKRALFFLLQFISLMVYVLILVAHLYYFNIFSFYQRTGYLINNTALIKSSITSIFLGTVSVFLLSMIETKLLMRLKEKKLFLISLLSLMLFLKIVFNHHTVSKMAFKVINTNMLGAYLYDYKKFKLGGDSIQNYQCNYLENVSPSIRYLLDTTGKRELLLIVESWGELIDTSAQHQCIVELKESFEKAKKESLYSYQLEFGRACFHGNTASAEGRELLNMNDEESYRAFIDKNCKPTYNLVDFKNLHGYYTISGFSASKRYGSNWSNAEMFRKILGFKTRISFEELTKRYNSNHENSYHSVSDENMIDSLINFSKNYHKVFAYGLTINTHTPFELDKSMIRLADYNFKKKKLLNTFNGNQVAFEQFYRISKIINHVFETINKPKNYFDKIIIIGDHASPELKSKHLYNQETVPFIFIRGSS